MKPSDRSIKKAIQLLKTGGVGVMPTDTLYGIVGSALKKKTVARIYRLRRRSRSKPMIVLIADADHVAQFEVRIAVKGKQIMQKKWPGKVSIILPCYARKFAYLHRGTKSIAFRVPKVKWLRDFLRETGPLVAPSANIQEQPPSNTVRDAKKYFGKRINFYLDGGTLAGKPSKVIKIAGENIVIVRK